MSSELLRVALLALLPISMARDFPVMFAGALLQGQLFTVEDITTNASTSEDLTTYAPLGVARTAMRLSGAPDAGANGAALQAPGCRGGKLVAPSSFVFAPSTASDFTERACTGLEDVAPSSPGCSSARSLLFSSTAAEKHGRYTCFATEEMAMAWLLERGSEHVLNATAMRSPSRVCSATLVASGAPLRACHHWALQDDAYNYACHEKLVAFSLYEIKNADGAIWHAFCHGAAIGCPATTEMCHQLAPGDLIAY